jgi:hypothetical protein
VLPIVLFALANHIMSLSPNAVSPTIRIDRTEFFLGEQVVFEIGKRTAEEVAGPALAEARCELRVVRPDGKAIVQQRGGPVSYDGPSRVSFLFQPELLNDIDDHMAVGKYQIIYACGVKKTSVSIQLRELPILKNIHVALQFPDRLRVSKDKSLRVGVTVSNESSTPIEIVIPDSNYWARVIAYADYEHPSASILFNSNAVAQAINNANYRVRISSTNMDRLKSHTIPAKGSYSTEIEFQGAAAGGGLVDSRWAPTDQFAVVGGLVLHLFTQIDDLPQNNERPIELLIRSKACYAVTGERQSTECEDTIRHWPHSPSD